MRRVVMVVMVVVALIALVAINSNLIAFNGQQPVVPAGDPGVENSATDESASTEQTKLRADQAILVAVRDFPVESIEVLDRYSGMLAPWKRYDLGFEIAGRVAELGKDTAGETIDVGSEVVAGQSLAKLDTELLEARLAEAEAGLTQADSHYRRVQQLRERGNSAVTEAEFQDRLAAKLLAEARVRVATKNLADATLIAPVDGVISRRMLEPGESIAPHTPAFELVEIDKMLLVVGVPETNLSQILLRKRNLIRNNKLADQAEFASEDLEFRAYVELIGRNRFGEPWPMIAGLVHEIAETADQRTGLFEIEVELPNPEHRLKPGMIARADLVTDRVQGMRIPLRSVVFRDNRAYVFTALPRSESEDTSADKPKSASTGERLYRAHQVELTRWMEQQGDVIALWNGDGLKRVVVRGQHRLTDGHLIRLTQMPSDENRAEPSDNSAKFNQDSPATAKPPK